MPCHFQATARLLMERGANIGMRNLFEETPISLILPETMEQFLDEHCLTSKGEVGEENGVSNVTHLNERCST